MFTSEILIIVLLAIVLLILSIVILQLRSIRQHLNEVDKTIPVKSFTSDKKIVSGSIDHRSDEIEELKSQLKAKTVELAKSEKDSKEKNKILNEIREKVQHCTKNPDSMIRVSKDIMVMLDAAVVEYDSSFEIQIDELHQDFAKSLRLKYPELTTHDLRLATYIKIGLNSKEISGLLNIKPSSVYISRSRLRKKINLDTDADLHGYLNSIQ